MLGRPVAAVFGLGSLAMLVQFVGSPLYADWVDVGAIWDMLSWVIAVVSLLALVVDLPAEDRGLGLQERLCGGDILHYRLLCHSLPGHRVLPELDQQPHALGGGRGDPARLVGGHRRALHRHTGVPRHSPLAKPRLNACLSRRRLYPTSIPAPRNTVLRRGAEARLRCSRPTGG